MKDGLTSMLRYPMCFLIDIQDSEHVCFFILKVFKKNIFYLFCSKVIVLGVLNCLNVIMSKINFKKIISRYFQAKGILKNNCCHIPNELSISCSQPEIYNLLIQVIFLSKHVLLIFIIVKYSNPHCDIDKILNYFLI